MSKRAKMIKLYGGEIKSLNIDDEAFIRHGDGSVEAIAEEDVESFIETHPHEDFAVIRVSRDVVDCISEMAAEESAQAVRPEMNQDITVGDMKALAFMYDNMGALYCEVLRSYTQFIRDGMRAEAAVYAAMLSWDLDIGGIEA